MTEMRQTFPATLDAVEPYLLRFRRLCQCLKSLSDRFAAELLLREALTNAVVHGSRENPGRLVRCAVRLTRRELRIAVEDEGGGFDWRLAGRGADGDLTCSGRGLGILRTYASSIRFNRKGNAVTIVKRFGASKKR